MYKNQLTGSIPSALGALIAITQLCGTHGCNHGAALPLPGFALLCGSHHASHQQAAHAHSRGGAAPPSACCTAAATHARSPSYTRLR